MKLSFGSRDFGAPTLVCCLEPEISQFGPSLEKNIEIAYQKTSKYKKNSIRRVRFQAFDGTEYWDGFILSKLWNFNFQLCFDCTLSFTHQKFSSTALNMIVWSDHYMQIYFECSPPYSSTLKIPALSSIKKSAAEKNREDLQFRSDTQ